MGCNCNKNKSLQNVNTNKINMENVNKENSSTIEFRKEAINDKKTISDKIGMVKSFSRAIVSRGFNNEKINKPTKQIRALSCFGNLQSGGELPPCEFLKNSQTPNKFFCGGCGCGDKPQTWLTIEGEAYSKLDYPKLSCPLKMPGFSNYESSAPDEQTVPITRRYYIEQINFEEVLKVYVTSPDPIVVPDQQPKSE